MSDTTTQPSALTTVELDQPIRRGESELKSIQIRKPKAGELRGVSLSDLFDMKADAVLTMIPRVSSPTLTATEVNQKVGPQQAKPGRLREQYGQLGVRKILQMAVRMERQLNSRGEGFTELEPRVVNVSEGEDKVEPVRLGDGGYIDVDWPPIARPSIADIAQAATAASAAKQGGVLDNESLVKWLAPYFGAEDIGVILARLEKEKADALAQQQAGFGGGEQPEQPETPPTE